jgi:hypothetical protein
MNLRPSASRRLPQFRGTPYRPSDPPAGWPILRLRSARSRGRILRGFCCGKSTLAGLSPFAPRKQREPAATFAERKATEDFPQQKLRGRLCRVVRIFDNLFCASFTSPPRRVWDTKSLVLEFRDFVAHRPIAMFLVLSSLRDFAVGWSDSQGLRPLAIASRRSAAQWPCPPVF